MKDSKGLFLHVVVFTSFLADVVVGYEYHSEYHRPFFQRQIHHLNGVKTSATHMTAPGYYQTPRFLDHSLTQTYQTHARWAPKNSFKL